MIRLLDIIFSFFGLLILLPFFILIAVCIKLSSAGSIFFIQQRVGKDNIDFRLIKFRTMKMDSYKKGLLTVGGRDPRITGIGYFLRKFKLDELPQLINVSLLAVTVGLSSSFLTVLCNSVKRPFIAGKSASLPHCS